MAATYLDHVLLSALQFKGGPSNVMRVDDWASWFVANGPSVAALRLSATVRVFLRLRVSVRRANTQSHSMRPGSRHTRGP